MSTYDPRQMAKDALVLATPPTYSGIKSFVSEEGVIALAKELEGALDQLDATEGQDKQISVLEETVQDQADTISNLKEKVERFATEVASL